MTEKDLPGFAVGAAEGLRRTFDLSDAIHGYYLLGSHRLWIERGTGKLKDDASGTSYKVETVCGALKKGALCWMMMAADNASLQIFEHGAVTLEGEAYAALVPVNAFDEQPPAIAHDAGKLHFSYNYRSGPFVRIMSGTVDDPKGLWNALLLLQPPPGAHGGYGMIGDDPLLGEKPGYGLTQLGRLAGKYVTFDRLRVEQPSGWESLGVASGVFTNVSEMNNATLGWAFFDVRSSFEDDLKKLLNLP
jgi:hypothetical protein